MCLNKTDNKVWTGKYLAERFATQIDLKQGHTLLPLHYSFALECPQLVAPGKLNGTQQLLVYTDDVNLLGVDINTTKKNAESLINPSKEADVQVNTEKTSIIDVDVLSPECRPKS
jgi:hypothetical protein